MEYAIDRIEKVRLGGVNQKIHIRGTRAENPVLLFLHGGPGISNRDSVMNRESDLCDAFTLVAWDQRGTGGSYWGVSKSSLTVDQLVSDARELVEYLCRTLGKQKLYIWGGSWGTELGTYLCYRHPEHIAAYLGSGQMVNGALNEEVGYDFAMQKAQEAGDAESVAILEKIGRPVGGCYREIFKVPTECTRFEMPYYIFQGALDNNTPSSLVQAYYDAIDAPDKALVWFEHSAHGPLAEEPQLYKQLMREKLLQWEA